MSLHPERVAPAAAPSPLIYCVHFMARKADQIVLARTIANTHMFFSLSQKGFRGVGISVVPDERRLCRYVVSFIHNEPTKSVVLEETTDDSDIVAKWRQWAKDLGALLLVEREANIFQAIEERLGDVTTGRAPRDRRAGFGNRHRRPRHRLRRKACFHILKKSLSSNQSKEEKNDKNCYE